MDIINNPVIIGLFAGTLTYAYLVWDEKQKAKNKKYKKEEINLLIPLVVMVIVWFVAYSYFEYRSKEGNSQFVVSELTSKNIPIKPFLPLPIPPEHSYKFVKDVVTSSGGSDTKSFSLLTKGITVPNKLPEVLLEMYN